MSPIPSLSLSPRATCLLAWTVAMLVAVGLVAGIALPWGGEVAQLDSQLADREDQILRYRRLLASLPALRAELEQERDKDEFKAFYYEAQTPALAGAQLQRELQDMVRAAGARLINTQFLPPADEEEPPRVQIRAQLQGRTDALLDVLYRIEQARPFLFVDQLSVRASARRTVRANPRLRGRRASARRQATGQLTIRLDVFGYALEGGQ